MYCGRFGLFFWTAAMPLPADDVLLDADVAALVRCHPRTVYREHLKGVGPPCTTIAGRRLYLKSDVELWLKERMRRPTPRAGRRGGRP
jgi:hypothetical protein